MTPYDINIEDKILYISKISPYMNIYNKYISNCKNQKEKFYVCLLDIQDFRYFNYIYGFRYGDKLLMDIAVEIKKCMGENAFISVYPDDSRDTSEVLKYAEIALNYTKRNTNEKCQIYESFMFSEIVRKISIFPDIDHALDNKEFILLYQPLINISTMTVYGAEALLRWNSLNFGLVSPIYFIDKLEHNRAIKY